MFPCGTVMLKKQCGTSLVVQWLRFPPSNAKGTGSVPGRGAKIPQALGRKTKTYNRSNIVTN